jgi:hypothetical protein
MKFCLRLQDKNLSENFVAETVIRKIRPWFHDSATNPPEPESSISEMASFESIRDATLHRKIEAGSGTNVMILYYLR